MSASWALQAAVVGFLKNLSTLKAAMGSGSAAARVLDHVPEDQPMPYVEYEDGQAAEWDAGASDGGMEYGEEHTFRLYAWSDYEGKKQAKAMLSAMSKGLRDAERTLELDGHRLINIRPQFSYVLRDAEGQAYYGVLQMRAVTEEM